MQPFAEFLISVIELLEAQVRELKMSAFWIVLVALFASTTLFFSLSGCGFLLWAAYGALAPAVGEPVAKVLTGLFSLAFAGGTLWIVRRLSR